MTVYDVIIVGGGASGLFCGAAFPQKIKGLLLEKSKRPGIKLCMTGNGQCNLTHNGDMKDFLLKYGVNGKKLRPVLYQYSNSALISYFQSHGIPLITRKDGKVFPASLQSQDILDLLLTESEKNGFELKCSSAVTGISVTATEAENRFIYTVHCGNLQYQGKKLIIATGGCSYPSTGSDGSFFPVLEELLELTPRRPALVPIYVQNYPYAALAGLSFSKIGISIQTADRKINAAGDLLFTHDCFSGPVILDHSRYVKTGDTIILHYLSNLHATEVEKQLKQLLPGNQKQIETVLAEYASLSKGFAKILCLRCGIPPETKTASLSGQDMKKLAMLLTNDSFSISGLGGFQNAMVTAGGVALSEINLKTMECKNYPGLYILGETLDVDGDTGGYNLQFAFSSGFVAAQA